MAEPTASESSAGTDSDQDFDPTADMLVNDFDDEHTLDEEEAMDDCGLDGEDDEVDDLQKESEMPLEELLALYGMGKDQQQATQASSASCPPTSSSAIERVEATSTSNMTNSTSAEAHSSTDPSSSMTSTSHLGNTNSSTTLDIPLLRSHLDHTSFTHINSHNLVSDSSEGESDEEEESSFVVTEEEWRRTIQVGGDYQASIPEGLSRYDGAPAYENEDRMLWDNTSHLEDHDIEDYLRRFAEQQSRDEQESSEDGVSSTLPNGSHVKDDENALFLLHQCGHNVEEALRRRRMVGNVVSITETMPSWSEEECKSFEAGLRAYGKDFHLIQLNKVRTRSVGELVQFYYLWKKTERHDVFATKCRLEKKKYTLHPGTTDYMDRFLDEQENLASSISSSLNNNNIQSSNSMYKQLNQSNLSYRVSPSQQNQQHMVDNMMSAYSNAFCDSGGTGSSPSAVINGIHHAKSNSSPASGHSEGTVQNTHAKISLMPPPISAPLSLTTQSSNIISRINTIISSPASSEHVTHSGDSISPELNSTSSSSRHHSNLNTCITASSTSSSSTLSSSSSSSPHLSLSSTTNVIHSDKS